MSRIDFDFLAFLVGPLALGGLIAGHIKILVPMPENIALWVVPGMWGGTSILTFWVIVQLRWDTVTPVSCALAFLAGALLFILLAWLFRLEQRQKSEQNAT
jgi:hypothetical protein